MKEVGHLFKIIASVAQLSGNSMIEKNNNLIRNFQLFILNNYRIILLISFIFIFSVLSFQIYTYLSNQEIKKTSINFFNSIEGTDLTIKNLNNIRESDNIFSVLSTLRIIQLNNKNNNFEESNKLYKELISSNKLDNLYKSSIAVHASFTFIDAAYSEKTSNYFNDIDYYIKNISDDLENFYSIKKELEYLFIILKADFENIEYENNPSAISKFNEIYNSNLISSTVKERVKKIHVFQLSK